MLQLRPNQTELRSMDYYHQILCRFWKCKQKVPPPSPLSTQKSPFTPPKDEKNLVIEQGHPVYSASCLSYHVRGQPRLVLAWPKTPSKVFKIIGKVKCRKSMNTDRKTNNMVEGHLNPGLFSPKLQPKTFQPQTFQTWIFEPWAWKVCGWKVWDWEVWCWNVL